VTGGRAAAVMGRRLGAIAGASAAVRAMLWMVASGVLFLLLNTILRSMAR
jgi:hypothetical protein